MLSDLNYFNSLRTKFTYNHEKYFKFDWIYLSIKHIVDISIDNKLQQLLTDDKFIKSFNSTENEN